MMQKFFIAVFCLALLAARSFAIGPSEKLLFEKNSLYQYILVIEDTVKKERYIRNYKRVLSQGGISLDVPDKLLFEYTQMSIVSLAFLEREPDDILMVGLGAGSIPRYLNRYYPDAAIDIVEIDPDMVSVAKEYFYFRENGNMRVYVEDGRVYVKRMQEKYDIIFLDAYQSDYIPFHLTTLEFLKEVKSKLKEDGV